MKAIKEPYDKSYFGRLKRFLLIRCLYLSDFFSGRQLELISVSEPPPFKFSGSYFILRWQVRGCHKVTVNGSVILPGNISSIRLDPASLSGSLLLSFHGYRHIITKQFVIRSTGLQVKRLLRATLTEPVLKLRALSCWPVLFSAIRTCRAHFPPAVLSIPRASLAKAGMSVVCALSLQLQLPPCDLSKQNL